MAKAASCAIPSLKYVSMSPEEMCLLNNSSISRQGIIHTQLDSKRDNNVILLYYDAQTSPTFKDIVKMIIKTTVFYPIKK